MNNTEKIAAVRRGERIDGRFSMHLQENLIPDCQHRWRTIACDNEHDVDECRVCGRQQVFRCNFDEEFQ